MQSANAPDYKGYLIRERLANLEPQGNYDAWFNQKSAPLGADEIDELDKRIPGRLKKRSRLFLQEPL